VQTVEQEEEKEYEGEEDEDEEEEEEEEEEECARSREEGGDKDDWGRCLCLDLTCLVCLCC